MIRTPACLISGFRREVAENWALVGCYAASSGNFFGTIYLRIFNGQESKTTLEDGTDEFSRKVG